jgi:hypothetical protein
MRSDWYVGHFENTSEEFESEEEPTKESYPKYDFCTGPFVDEKRAISYKRWFNGTS